MRNDYLTTEEPMKAILFFAMPMIIGNLFQQIYTMVDSAVVGRYVSAQALAAVGASYALTNIFICVAVGGGIGASVIVSRYFGAMDYQRMRNAVHTAFVMFVLTSIVLAVIGLLFSKQIMILLNTPLDVLDMADTYLRIYFMGLPFLFLYNVLSSMFNSLGKSRIPLAFLIFSSILNIGLDIWMVKELQLGVAGVAWATLIAQGVSAFLSAVVFVNVIRKFKGEGHYRLFDQEEFFLMINIALPSILQQSIVTIGMMLVQSVVNSFGSQSLAGFSAAMRIESICVVPLSSMGNAMSSYIAQNIGAKKKKRVAAGGPTGMMIVTAFCILICVILEGFSRQIIGSFVGASVTEETLYVGTGYLKFMGFFFILLGFKMVIDGALRGAGLMRVSTIANLVNLGIRVVLSITLAPMYGIALIWMAVPVGWLGNLVISTIEYRRRFGNIDAMLMTGN